MVLFGLCLGFISRSGEFQAYMLVFVLVFVYDSVCPSDRVRLQKSAN